MAIYSLQLGSEKGQGSFIESIVSPMSTVAP